MLKKISSIHSYFPETHLQLKKIKYHFENWKVQFSSPICFIKDYYIFKYQITGAQEWHIVPLLDDVTSPTTAVPYSSMTSELRVLSTEKHWPVRRQHAMYTNKSSQCKGEVNSSPLNK